MVGLCKLWRLRCEFERGLLDLRLFPGPGRQGEGVRFLVGYVRQPSEDVDQVFEEIERQRQTQRSYSHFRPFSGE